MFSYFDALTGSHSDQGTSRSRFDGWSLEERDPYVIESLLPLGEWLYRYYFRVTTDGWHHLSTDGGVLIVGSHNGGIIAPDTLMFMVDWFRQFGSERPVYGLMHPNVWMVPIYLDGSTPAPERKKRVDAFQAGSGDVFLISLKAGGTGLNLTAADYVIHMDPWWNPAVEDQASDRAHRIGQQRPVTIYRLVAKETIEDKIVDLHHHKRDLADSLLEGADMSGKISTEALLQLING